MIKFMAVIPAYNEAKHISQVVRKARPYLPVLVVDDGSVDETARLAEAAGAEVLRQVSNQGKGAALRAGFLRALELGCGDGASLAGLLRAGMACEGEGIDLPGRQSLLAGLALAARGYRPVPLYNACSGISAVVPMEPILDLIARAATYLAGLFLPDDAPPAFLLDADRLRGSVPPAPGRFDNRWLVFPQDFPSANFLRSRAVHSVLLVQAQADQPQSDLGHVLLRWQQAGLPLQVVPPVAGAVPQPLQVRRPRLFGWMWQRALASLGLRRNSAGGFGAIIPLASSGSG